ncbi:hypothetical protein VTJ04DRAFT_1889 [Mycothermus thermophilus]|uniref:uncharacterized protein n=1 Tax=Humicola insolens TaxID=85995 RepID=UPI0037439E6C
MAALNRATATLQRVAILRTNLDNILRTRGSFPNLRNTADQHFSNATSSSYEIIESQTPTDPSLHIEHPAPSHRPGTPPPCDLAHAHTANCVSQPHLFHPPPRPSSSMGFSHFPPAPTSAATSDFSHSFHTSARHSAPPAPTSTGSSGSYKSGPPPPPPQGTKASQISADAETNPAMDFGGEIKGNPTDSEADVAADRSDVDPLPPGMHHTIRMGPGEAGPVPTESEADVAADLGRSGEDPLPEGEHFTDKVKDKVKGMGKRPKGGR